MVTPMDPNHRRLRELVLAYEELEPGDRARADAHLAECSECRALLARLQEVERKAASPGTLPDLDDPSLTLKTDGEIGEAERSLLLLRERIGLETPAAPKRHEAREPEGWFEHLIADMRALIPDRRWALVPIAAAAIAFVALWPRPSGDPLLVKDLQLSPESGVRGGTPGWHTGEAFTLRFELTSPAKVVVFHVGADARPALLYPFEPVALTTNEAEGTIVLPPPASGVEWRLEGEPGPERFVVAAGARGAIDVAALVAEAAVLDSVGESSASVSQSLELLLERRVGPVRSIEIQHLP